MLDFLGQRVDSLLRPGEQKKGVIFVVNESTCQRCHDHFVLIWEKLFHIGFCKLLELFDDYFDGFRVILPVGRAVDIILAARNLGSLESLVGSLLRECARGLGSMIFVLHLDISQLILEYFFHRVFFTFQILVLTKPCECPLIVL